VYRGFARIAAAVRSVHAAPCGAGYGPLVAGDKAGKWEAWYRQAIPLAEQRYEDYLKQEGTR
jgi:hypothetical protein